MRLKDYQRRVLDAVAEYLNLLADWRGKAERAARIEPDITFDWARRAWEELERRRKPYLARRNGLGEPLPSFCLKVPTGGGKTLLAIRALDLVNSRFRCRRFGLVLWVVPSTQIYNQTLRALRDRDHPYRQQLDLASGDRTRILEKTDAFSRREVADNLCVLLLMLPSANRQTKEQLRMFRDAGGFEDFFPPEDDQAAQRKLLAEIPNLDCFGAGGGAVIGPPKTSLGNALRLVRPLVILDEGHKAYSTGAKATLEGFNPCMIVELSATPPKDANVLVEILGKELNDEEMIKLDLHITNDASWNWQATLLSAVEHRRRLEAEAERYRAATGRYIRPICLVQVERTGRGQRKPGLVHAEDVREYLLRHSSIAPEHIAVKTSEKDDLKELDEAGGLLSPDCPVRFIITKQALQEGWDCSFAYVLAILANPGSKSALTQLVGRILRQPYAVKTGVSWLDESQVFCFRRNGAELLKEVRRGFGLEGLGGLADRIALGAGASAAAGGTVTLRQRPQFREAAERLVLPAFVLRDEGSWRPVFYEADILSRIAWDDLEVGGLADLELLSGPSAGRKITTGLDGAELLSRSEALPASGGDAELDYVFAANHLLGVVPNPWRSMELLRPVFDALLARYSREQVAEHFVFVLESLRRHLEVQRDELARRVFHDLLRSGEMRFLVVTEALHPLRLPAEMVVPKGRQANREDGSAYVRNLFDRTMEDELNGLENRVASWIDGQERLYFWYRNRARKDYFVQGWKRDRIYPDFLWTLRPDPDDDGDEGGAIRGDDDRAEDGGKFDQVFVVETKGLHLEDSKDTDYKKSVFALCAKHARKTNWAEFAPAMRGVRMRYEVVAESAWEQRLQSLFAGPAPPAADPSAPSRAGKLRRISADPPQGHG